MDKLTAMKVFVRVAKAGSFVGGAKEMSISRAMATKHIGQLESHLGARLFNRTTRSLSLTDVGAAYLKRCRTVLGDIDEMEDAVTQLHTEPRGKLKISSPPIIGALYIAPAISEFLAIHNDLTVNLVLQTNFGDLVDEGIDIAITFGGLDDTSHVAKKIASSRLVVCGSPAYFAEYGKPLLPEDLENHSCLINWTFPPRNKWKFKGLEGEREIQVHGRMETNAADPIRIAAKKDLGLVMLPEYIVARDIEKGYLQVVLDDYAIAPVDIHAVYPHRKYLSAKVRAFLTFLEEWLRTRSAVRE
ncbi:LysR family transcriptional regulator [Methyloprofundus sedimenti]|uniref:LysR family transcriptional regulator n=1 Tax=Methyloprofundus sedimenti TaxID=1420851 RepID=A0A1V8M5L6_9GAMM|nr:LysR family transcriptional regulator [Methyloprofundus sedimenti]OQK16844.1 LysR family transcriptional regulator [Methyloprofundus sedimenti]